MGLLESIIGAARKMGGGGEGAPPEPREDGLIVPFDMVGDAVTAPNDQGDLKPVDGVDLQDSDLDLVYGLVKKIFAETDQSRRAHLKRVLRGRSAFDGKNNVVWDEGLVNYVPINQVDMTQYGMDDDETDVDPVLNFNIHQSTGLSIISAQSAGKPNVRWFPADATNPLDALTAEKNSDIIDLFFRTNEIKKLQNRMGKLHWTDGIWFAYVRFKRDAQRWGTHDEPIYGMVDTPIGLPFYQCQNCGAQTPVQDPSANTGAPGAEAPNTQLANPMAGGPPGPPDGAAAMPPAPAAPPPPPMGAQPPMASGPIGEPPSPGGPPPPQDPNLPPTCNGCGYPLDPMSAQPAPTAPTQQQIGVKQVPNGFVVVDPYGVPETRTPPEATSIPTCGYIALQTEEDPAYLKALYEKMAKKITGGGTSSEESLVEEKISRLSPKSAMKQSRYGGFAENTNKMTWTRIWMRPWQLAGITDDAARERLLKAFTKGAFFSFAGNVCCEHRNLTMDDYWVDCAALPSENMAPPPTGEILLDVNDGLNDLMDSEFSAARHAVPLQLMAQEMVSAAMLQQANSAGGSIVPIELKDGRPPSEGIYETGTAAALPNVVSLRQELFGSIPSNLSGALPGLTGAGDPNLKTKGSYEQARDQALGKQAITWEQTKAAWTRICELAVKHFVENQDNDVMFPKLTATGFANVTIKKGELLGKAQAFAEEDESFPLSMTDKKDNLLQLQAANPMFGAIPQDMENYPFLKAATGLNQVIFPGEAGRKKQLHEIEFLKTQAPVPGPPVPVGPGINPVTNMPDPTMPPQMGPGPDMPSIPISPKTDENEAEWKAGVAWLQTDEAQQLAISNPAGHQNVILHIAAHFDAKNGFGMQPPGMPPGGPGGPPPPGGGGPPGGESKGPKHPTPHPPPPSDHHSGPPPAGDSGRTKVHEL